MVMLFVLPQLELKCCGRLDSSLGAAVAAAV